jgi:putative DeoR family transcriptional regulator (stage III sporulation protein D)
VTDKELKAVKMGECLIQTRHTLHQVAKEFGVSTSTVHRYIRHVLPSVNPDLYQQCATILEYHNFIKHIRGGEANRIRVKKRLQEIES